MLYLIGLNCVPADCIVCVDELRLCSNKPYSTCSVVTCGYSILQVLVFAGLQEALVMRSEIVSMHSGRDCLAAPSCVLCDAFC